jgi:hypothetical protein
MDECEGSEKLVSLDFEAFKAWLARGKERSRLYWESQDTEQGGKTPGKAISGPIKAIVDPMKKDLKQETADHDDGEVWDGEEPEWTQE